MVSDGQPGTGATPLARLNPCSNGIWSLTQSQLAPELWGVSLNPCSNGIWSLTHLPSAGQRSACVLILVLMEYGL